MKQLTDIDDVNKSIDDLESGMKTIYNANSRFLNDSNDSINSYDSYRSFSSKRSLYSRYTFRSASNTMLSNFTLTSKSPFTSREDRKTAKDW
eukprot:CAMPEP_0116974598 /NCGR_PEP_ID=MMETSP0467-20121206/55274_1 /TAXON_ID=283647 /ORGANISM="Mesodinium pulex, Strain SPMC105" /LENGTH=91 /DNA_ID=CAMNT_0004666793 /DNA_START=236 /DNA_END=511 /DNA_ORIENTATION=+